jgi:hypothetical protein
METKKKPTLDDVLKETGKKISYWIFKQANKLPQEQKDEIRQIALMTIFEKYGEIEAEGWKSWLNDRCRGFVLDYIKQRKGFISFGKKMSRAENSNSEGDEITIDQNISKYGLLNPKDKVDIQIDWDLCAKLASKDLAFKAFIKNKVLGITLEVLVPHFNLETTRINQLVQEFVDRFDSPEHADCEWFKQCCFALGLCKVLDIPNHPQYLNDSPSSIGEHLEPIDLWDETPHPIWLEKQNQMSFDI